MKLTAWTVRTSKWNWYKTAERSGERKSRKWRSWTAERWAGNLYRSAPLTCSVYHWTL